MMIALTDVHWPLWMVLTAGALMLLSWIKFQDEDRPLALLLAWISINGAITMELKSRMSEWAGGPGQAFMGESGSAICAIMAMIALCMFAKGEDIFTFLVWFGALHAFFMIGDQTIWRAEPIGGTIGMLGNRSIGASFLAVWVPISFRHRFGTYLATLGVFAILLTPSSMGFLGLLAAIFGLMIPFMGLRSILVTAGLLALTLWLFGPLIDPDMFHMATRYPVWEEAALFQWRQGIWSTLCGLGLGSFKVLGHPLVAQHIRPGRTWLWLHNDWLQIIFELGIVGFALFLLFYIRTLIRSWDRPYLVAGLVSFGAAMVGNYPLHMAVFALLGAWMVKEAFHAAP